MADNSSIEWTEATWNPVTGCTKVSPGCAHCYAETVADRFWATQYPPITDKTSETFAPYQRPRMFHDVMCHEDRLDQPLRWRRPRRIFVNSMSDLFHDDVPDAFIDQVFAVMALASQHTFQVLTKRAERMRAYLADRVTNVADAIRSMDVPHAEVKATTLVTGLKIDDGPARRQWPIRNVWLGVSVENQRCADERIPLLLQTPAAVRFISAEPLLGPTDLSNFLTAGDSDNPKRALNTHGQTGTCLEHGSQLSSGKGHAGISPSASGQSDQGAERPAVRKLDWVIVGGESGKGARPFAEEWARSILQQCRASKVPVFMKQLGSNPYTVYVTDKTGAFIGGAGGPYRNRKGGDTSEWPEDLRVRQFPQQQREQTDAPTRS